MSSVAHMRLVECGEPCPSVEIGTVLGRGTIVDERLFFGGHQRQGRGFFREVWLERREISSVNSRSQ